MSENVETAGQGFLSSALLVTAVSGILLAGFLLKSGPQDATAGVPASAEPPVPTPALGSTIVPEPGPAISTKPAEPEPDVVPAASAPAAPAPRAQAVPLPAKPVAVQPPPAADPLVLRLAERAERDHSRLAKAAGHWTAQLIVACKPETVDRVLTTGGSSPKLYVLPAHLNDEACFRVCFGAYLTAKEAAAAADLPKALRGKEKVGAVEIAKVLL